MLNRSAKAFALFLLSVACSACFESTLVLRVSTDGTGTVQQQTIVKKAALSQLRSFSALGGGRATLDPLSEDQARALAATLGPGVTYVSSTAIKNDAGEGRDSLYSFTDVSQLRVSETPQPPGGITIKTDAISTDGPAITLSLSHEASGNVVLHIVIPPPALFDPNGRINPAVIEQLQGLKAMLAGAHLLITMEPNGRFIRSSSPFVDGSRVTLLEVDVDRVLGDTTFVPRLQDAKSIDEVKAVVKATPGLKINLDPEVTIEFGPQ